MLLLLVSYNVTLTFTELRQTYFDWDRPTYFYRKLQVQKLINELQRLWQKETHMLLLSTVYSTKKILMEKKTFTRLKIIDVNFLL